MEERKDKMSTMRELASALAGIRECEARIADYREKIKREEEACRFLEKFGDKLDIRFVQENSRIERTLGTLLLTSYSGVVRALFFASPAGVMIVSAGRARWCSTVSEAVNVLRKEKDEVEIWTEVEESKE